MYNLYHTMGLLLAEGFGLLERRKEYEKSAFEKKIEQDYYDFEQTRKPPHKRFEFGLSKQDKKNRRTARKIAIAQMPMSTL